ncbi:family 20 glycosylhydrolase [Sphingomonas profundi]|uniref:family 20 glycosylhydrolase n=1 Tax=Alterirhizorhabdus profundi TaxID=2681549 RepID=UPI0018D0F3EE|nr:family 20 glycosylhydrolase [Sphingomonas profundi]
MGGRLNSLTLAALLLAASPAPAAPLLLPRPAEMTEQAGAFALSAATPVTGDPAAAAAFVDLMRRTAGVMPGGIVPRGTGGPAIRFVRRAGFAAESYAIDAAPAGITVSAGDAAGLYYGAVTLWQLATQADAPGRIAAVAIRDEPRFAWRGLMLDSARHFQSPAFIKRLIEWMALNKLNRFHWHLVDDQGWRLQIAKYPRLTDVSAWRVPATAPGAPPLPRVGGFYTQAEVREIVAFAAARGVTIVPEIEMPGHALAAIRAYPELGMGVPIPPGTEAEWGVFPWLYNVGEPTFRFLTDVLDEVMALFPSPVIHIGGDEAVKDQWRADPAVQAKIRALGLKDEDALQSWFVQRIGRYLAAHGRRLIGWDEILDGGVAGDAMVMSWRGVDGAVTAAKAGHDAVLAPSPTLYFDRRQGMTALEPPGRGTPETLEQVYAFDPMPPALDDQARRHILGLEATLFTEHVRTEDRAAWMLFPRALAIAETGWSPAAPRDYPAFRARVAPQLARMAPLGLSAATSAFLPAAPADPASRDSTALTTCADKVALYLEDDAPAAGPRAKFLIDILQPCWRWQGAALDGVRGIAIDVGQLPFNFQIGKDRDGIRFRPPATPAGEMEVRADGCDGAPIATLPLGPAAANPAVTRLRAALPPLGGRHDLCFTYTARGPDPLWAIDRVTLERAP